MQRIDACIQAGDHGALTSKSARPQFRCTHHLDIPLRGQRLARERDRCEQLTVRPDLHHVRILQQRFDQRRRGAHRHRAGDPQHPQVGGAHAARERQDRISMRLRCGLEFGDGVATARGAIIVREGFSKCARRGFAAEANDDRDGLTRRRHVHRRLKFSGRLRRKCDCRPEGGSSEEHLRSPANGHEGPRILMTSPTRPRDGGTGLRPALPSRGCRAVSPPCSRTARSTCGPFSARPVSDAVRRVWLWSALS